MEQGGFSYDKADPEDQIYLQPESWRADQNVKAMNGAIFYNSVRRPRVGNHASSGSDDNDGSSSDGTTSGGDVITKEDD